MKVLVILVLLFTSFVDSALATKSDGPDSFFYYSLENPIVSELGKSQNVLRAKLTLMTLPDDRVIQNVIKHDMAIKAAIVSLIRKKTDIEIRNPLFKQQLENEIRELFNAFLENHTSLGGIEEVLLTEFEIKPKEISNQQGQKESQRQQPRNQINSDSVDVRRTNDQRRRYALVVGNASYNSLPKLQNTLNDSRSISKSLQRAGFSVTTAENLDLAGMQNAVRSFGEKLGKNDVGLFYYAGHAVQFKGKNYLIPVKENIKKSFEVPAGAVDVDLILATLESVKNDLNIVILDSCRSPFPGETRGATRGLATIEAAKGTFIAFATAPGKEAFDGTGSNSPYTKHLSRMIGQKGLPLEQVFKEVRKAVVAETNGEQVPWENSSLMGDFYFVR